MQESRFHWLFIIVGYYLLIQSAFFDNIRGPLLPIFANEMAISYDRLSAFVFAGSIVGLFVTLSFDWLVRWIDDSLLTAAALVFALLLTFAVGYVDSYGGLVLLAMGIGTIVATFGTLCNLLVIHGVPAQWNSKALSGLHAMYGFGSVLASMAGAQFDLTGGRWRLLFYGSAVFLGLHFLLILPRVKFKHEVTAEVGKAPPHKPFGVLQWWTVCCFGLYVFCEVGISMWLVTFLVESWQMTVEMGSTILMGFFIALTGTRILAIGFVKDQNELAVLLGSLGTAFVAGLLGILVNPYFWILAGVLGPFFPVMLGRVTRASKEVWRLLTVRIIVGTQITLGIGHFLIGQIAAGVGAAVAISLPVLMAAVVIVLVLRIESLRTQALFR